ncbi:Ankyrin repeat and sterile alpha motif domain-containing protein 1B [Ataeniobius toweri]|uniref:Ankyrin repeat and sterile alpha motif domain-containing protein 1B n=1 Tax=Ataeniobius toweri TaxID=208326 RepID=A0ABU7AL28_9TELE|nr:Ankyrin repeat and sterile alpha motif domain-containing protein 1B [Ataeniobius toweri]
MVLRQHTKTDELPLFASSSSSQSKLSVSIVMNQRGREGGKKKPLVLHGNKAAIKRKQDKGSELLLSFHLEGEEVLKINLIGHRKRILASLGDRLHDDTPQKPPRAISLREPGGNHTPPQLSPSVGQAAYTAGVPGGSLDVQHLIMQADARRRQRSTENYFDDVPRSKLERQMAQVSMAGEWCEPITLRPPNEATSSTPVQYWQHHPEKLIFQSCDYEAYSQQC